MKLSKWLFSANNLTAKLDFQREAIAKKIAKNPYYRFQSATEIAIAEELGIKIDVNKANVDDWLRLPGISIHQAKSLVELTDGGLQFLCIEDVAMALGISVMKINIWQPIIYFCYYDAKSFHTPLQININLATFKQLQKIPGLDENLARKIILNRQKNGNYRNLADLKKGYH
jgi:DNA uptake protein ComE-like DNA-binding protein